MTYCKEKLSKQVLVDLFKVGCKQEEYIGVEYERLPIYKADNRTLSYYGEFGVCEILKEYARKDNWDYILDNDEIIGLKKIHDTITLEPGSQIELSIEPQKIVSDIKKKIDDINSTLIKIFDKYDIKLLRS